MDVFLDRKTYTSLVGYCRQHKSELAASFIKAAERGMRFFRAAYYKEMKQDYLLLRKQAEKYERDNKMLHQLIDENARFKQLLSEQLDQNKGREDES